MIEPNVQRVGDMEIIGPDPRIVGMVEEAQRQQRAIIRMLERLTAPMVVGNTEDTSP